MVAHVIDFQILDRLNNDRRDQRDVMPDPGQLLQRVEKQRGGRTQKRRRLAGNDTTVRKLDRNGRTAGFLRALKRGSNTRALVQVDPDLVHQKFDLCDLRDVGNSLTHRALCLIESTNDLTARCRATNRFVRNAHAGHIHAHIRRALIWRLPEDPLENRVHDGIYLHIAIVIHRCFAVRLKMVRIDHIDIVQIRGRRLVRDVDRVLKRKIPDRKCLKFRVTGIDPALVLMIKLRQACGHFTGSRSRRCDDHQRARRFDIFILAVAVLADDRGGIRRVSRNRIMAIDLHSESVQAFLELLGRRLSRIMCDDHTADKESDAGKRVDQTKDVLVISDTQISSAFILLDRVRADDQNDLGLVLELQEHLYLAVRLETRKHAGGMIIVEKFAAELQIQFSSETVDPVPNILRLKSHIFLVIKADLTHLCPFLRVL